MASSADARPAVIFFDCDDCLYKNDWKVANLLTAKIESFCSERLQMREGYAYELYKKWGTCLRGMQQEGILDDAMVEEYLEYSHDVPLHPEHTASLELMTHELSTAATHGLHDVFSERRPCPRSAAISPLDDLGVGGRARRLSAMPRAPLPDARPPLLSPSPSALFLLLALAATRAPRRLYPDSADATQRKAAREGGRKISQRLAAAAASLPQPITALPCARRQGRPTAAPSCSCFSSAWPLGAPAELHVVGMPRRWP